MEHSEPAHSPTQCDMASKPPIIPITPVKFKLCEGHTYRKHNEPTSVVHVVTLAEGKNFHIHRTGGLGNYVTDAEQFLTHMEELR